ncbi:Mss4-like protein [Crepidotus variabilis]|uniref:Mss4-like protein n=1 Tax=Crepidotus variabilis TaxID=179855 RepID=A0A9P6JLP2_9AGAR|nr:Mss4-like protein [Crepidotus variabilis]
MRLAQKRHSSRYLPLTLLNVCAKSYNRLRQSQAGDLFLGVYTKKDTESTNASRKLIAYVCSTLSPDTTLTHHSMSTHIPNSSSVCIHSVCVAKSHQRNGVGLALLREYIKRLEAASQQNPDKYQRILLITHEELKIFYECAGFEWVGKSSVVHGSKPWFEMRRDLTSSHPRTQTPTQMLSGPQQIPPGVLEALQRPRTDVPQSRLLSDFPHALSDLLEEDRSQAGTTLNKFDLLCPRVDCGSIILKKGAAKWVERDSIQLEPEDSPQDPRLPALPVPPDTAQWWLVTGSPMAFENIGFTRPVQPLLASGQKIKLLICGECDLGPLGWSEEGGSEFWLACSRVAYRI